MFDGKGLRELYRGDDLLADLRAYVVLQPADVPFELFVHITQGDSMRLRAVDEGVMTEKRMFLMPDLDLTLRQRSPSPDVLIKGRVDDEKQRFGVDRHEDEELVLGWGREVAAD